MRRPHPLLAFTLRCPADLDHMIHGPVVPMETPEGLIVCSACSYYRNATILLNAVPATEVAH